MAAVALLAATGVGAWWYFAAGPGVPKLAGVSAGKGPPATATAPVPGAAKPGGPPAGGGQPVSVEAVAPRKGTARQTIAAVGTFRSNEAVMIRPEIASRVKEFNFQEGQRVAKGQILVRMDASIDEAQLAQADAALALSRANFERANSLLARQAGTEKSLDEARAALRRDEASLMLARVRVEKYALVAPFEGVVGLRRVSIGSYLNIGADIVNLEQIDTLKVDFRVPENFLAVAKIGQTIGVSVDALPGRSFEGHGYAIDPLIDEAGRSIVIRATVDNRELSLRPGVFARVTLTLAQRENALFVPEQALVPIGDKQTVFRIVDGKAVPTPVTLGIRGQGEAEILTGLRPDDMVVTAGHLRLRPGLPVVIVPVRGSGGPPTPGASPAAGKPPAAKPTQPKTGD